MKLKKLRNIALSVIFMITLNVISLAQINLVSNPSFEMIYSCPNGANEIDSAIGWSTPKNGGGGNPELFNVCCTLPLICGVPSQTAMNNFQYAHSGNSYAGIDVIDFFHPDDFREYIQSKFKKNLSAGSTYCVKLYVSLSDQSSAFIKLLGAYLDDGSVSAPSLFGLAAVTPQVYNTLQPLNDTVNWMKIEGSFVATGNEEFITLGNFFADSISGLGFFGTPTYWHSYYYIDDVSVIDASLPAYAGKDTLIHYGDSIFLGRQPEVGLDEDCIWFVNGLPIDTVAGKWVKPDSTTTYILEQTICGNVSYDTVTVSVYGTAIESYTKDGKGITLYPNPVTNVLNIESNTKFSQFIISDILGNVVIRQQVYNKAVSVDVSGLGKGLYFVKMVDEKGFVVKKFLKE